MDKKQYDKILQFLSRGAIGFELPKDVAVTTKGIFRVWEELHYTMPVHLDELANQLGGDVKVSATKERALARLRPLFATASGLDVAVNCFDLNSTKENHMSKFTSPETEETTALATTTKKKAVAKSAKVVAKKKAATKPAKVVVKKKAVVTKKKTVTKPAKVVAKKKTTVAGTTREGTVAAFIKTGIGAGHDNEKIVAGIRKNFSKSKATTRDVAWYRWKLGQ